MKKENTMKNIVVYHIGVDSPITPAEPLPALPAVPRGALVVLEGKAPVWRYVKAFHALHGLTSAVGVYDPRLGVVIVASHSPEYAEGTVLDIEL